MEDEGKFVEKKEGVFIDPITVMTTSPLIYKGSASLLNYLQNLRKIIKIKEEVQTIPKSFIDTVINLLSIIPPIPSNTIIIGKINEFERAGGIPMSKLLSNATDDTFYALMFLEAFGVIFKYNIGGETYFLLTRLGNFIKEKTKNLDPIDRIILIIIIGTLFHTKARVIYECILANISDTESLYKTLKSRYISFRPMIEILDELKLTHYGTEEGYITETHVILSAYTGIGMIDYNIDTAHFPKREKEKGYIDAELMASLIYKYGENRLVYLTDLEYFEKRARSRDPTKELPKRYLDVLKMLEERPSPASMDYKWVISAEADILYEY